MKSFQDIQGKVFQKILHTVDSFVIDKGVRIGYRRAIKCPVFPSMALDVIYHSAANSIESSISSIKIMQLWSFNIFSA